MAVAILENKCIAECGAVRVDASDSRWPYRIHRIHGAAILMVTWIINIPQSCSIPAPWILWVILKTPVFFYWQYLFTIEVWCFSSMESPKTSAIDCNTRMLSNGNRQGHEMARHFSACLTHHRYMNGESIRIDAGIRMGKLWWAGVWPPVHNRETQRRRGRRALVTWINVARRRSEDFKAPALEKKGSWNHVRFTILKGIHHV